MTNSKRSSALESNAGISGARSAKPAPRKKIPDRMLSPGEKVAKHATAFAEHSTRLARLEYLQALKKMQLANLGYGNHPEVTSATSKSQKTIEIDVVSQERKEREELIKELR